MNKNGFSTKYLGSEYEHGLVSWIKKILIPSIFTKMALNNLSANNRDFFLKLKRDTKINQLSFYILGITARLIYPDINKISREQIIKFCYEFPIAKDIAKTGELIFKQALSNAQTIESLALGITKLYPNNNELYNAIIFGLISVMRYENHILNVQINKLNDVARVFKISKERLKSILRQNIVPENASIYEIMEIKKVDKITTDSISNTYKNLAKKYHPDRITEKDVSNEYLICIRQRFALIHKAYQNFKIENIDA